MRAKEFNKLLKKHSEDLHMIVRLHCLNRIYLTDLQLDKVLKLRGERVSKGQY